MANSSGNMDPWAVTRDLNNNIGDSALDARYTLGGLGHPAGVGYGFGDGVFPSYMNGSKIGDFQVNPTAPTASMAAVISAGNAQIARTSNGPYLGATTQPLTVTFAQADALNPRYDIVVMRTMDPGVDTTPTQSWFPVVLQGTPAASPALPSNLLLDNDLALAVVTIRANTSQVLASDITDSRIHATARGGIVPKSSADTRNGAYDGQYRDNPVTGSLERWGTATSSWVPVASNATWSVWTPPLYYGGNGDQGQPGTSLVGLGTGSFSMCKYNVVGKIMHVSYVFQCGTPPYNFGVHDISTTLPPGFTHRTGGGHEFMGCVLWVKNEVGFAQVFTGFAICDTGTQNIFFLLPSGTLNGTSVNGYYRAAQSQGVPGSSVPPVGPSGFPQGGSLNFSGVLELA